VIRDRIFSFYYAENLAALRERGAQLIELDSFADCLPGELDALYIGGGFPEVFAAELAGNRALKNDIKQSGEAGLPIYAECGGLMYLGRSIMVDGGRFPMVGLLPFDTVMEAKPQGHGYTIMHTLPGNSWFNPGIMLKGHEFHNSRLINLDPDTEFVFTMERGRGIDGQHDGILYRATLATYSHLYYDACPAWADSFVSLARQYQTRRKLANEDLMTRR
jgi:cobyrinic acid a,c-diamide synthase